MRFRFKLPADSLGGSLSCLAFVASLVCGSLVSPPIAAAQSAAGCCWLPSGACLMIEAVSCTALDGAFFADDCAAAGIRCRRPRALHRLPARVIKPHGPHVTLLPAVTATPPPPQQPTPTATETPIPLPVCGNQVVEPGEECESDADCNTPAEGCTVNCECVGGVEVWLRWSNQNDIDLSVTDPLGQIYVPLANANGECQNLSKAPSEFVYLPPGSAPAGCYLIQAHFTNPCPEADTVDTHLDIRLNIEGFKSTAHDIPGPSPNETYLTVFGVRASCP